MRTISYRELQRISSEELKGRLPCGITVDSQGIAIILSVDDYKRLLSICKNTLTVNAKLSNHVQPKQGGNDAITRTSQEGLSKGLNEEEEV